MFGFRFGSGLPGRRQWASWLAAIGVALAVIAGPEEATALDPPARLSGLIADYCLDCHDQSGALETGADLSVLGDPKSFRQETQLLASVLERIESGSMPPAEASQPTEQDRSQWVKWLEAELLRSTGAELNDPGIVVMPRLNHNEYNRVIEQLTGHPIDAAKYLPKDPQGGEGFLNVGYEQAITAGQVEKYLDAANYALTHAFVSPSRGILWHKDPIDSVALPGQYRKALIDRWVVAHRNIDYRLFGHRPPPDCIEDQALPPEANDFDSAPPADATDRRAVRQSDVEALWLLWRYRHLPSTDRPSLAEFAQSRHASVPTGLLELWWKFLTTSDFGDPRYQTFRQKYFGRWFDLPAPDRTTPAESRAVCEELIEPLRRFQQSRPLGEQYELQVDFFGDRRSFVPPDSDVYLTINPAGRLDSQGNPRREWVILTNTEFRFNYKGELDERWRERWPELIATDGRRFPWGQGRDGISVADDEALVELPVSFKIPVPKGCTAIRTDVKFDPRLRGDAWGQAFFSTQPPRPAEMLFKPGELLLGTGFAYTAFERLSALRRYFCSEGTETRQHMPYVAFYQFDRFPLRYLDASTWLNCRVRDGRVVSDAGPEALGGDHRRPHMLTAAQLRRDGSAEERALIENLAEDLQWAAQMPLQDIRQVLVDHGLESAVEGDELAADLLAEWPAEQRQTYRRLFASKADFEKRLESKARPIVEEFAGRAWRRQAQSDEIDRMMEAYRAERRIGGSFDASVKQAIKAVMVSPDFLFRPSSLAGTPGPEIRPLSDLALAHRMAFVLWGAGPDDELLQAAADGKLGDDDSIRRHVRRMLRDEKSEALATDFVGQWLGFADFHLHTRPNPDRFPEYDAELRQAMYQEIVRFVHDLFASDRPVMDLIQADYTFANDRLAEFYGLPKVKGDRFRQVSIPESLQSQRGGIFGMGAVLTRTSTALRTSPVLRGAWLYREVLGNPMPEPPPDVPMISADETDDEGRSIAQQLAKHRESAVCASCHDRIDPPGVVLEHFDPIGQWRQTYLSGSPIDVKSELQSGEQIDGLVGLRQYLQGRRDRFATQFAKKFLAYALGRQLLLTDKPLIDQMVTSLESEDYRPSSLIEAAILSQQFRTRRDLHDVTAGTQ